MPAPAPSARDAGLAGLIELQSRVAAIETLLRGRPPWVEPALLNAWKNAAGSEPAAYTKDLLGFVHLRGRVQSGASGKTIFELPEGFRPGKLSDYPAGALNGETALAATIIVSEAGIVNGYYAAGMTDFGLGGVSFFAEN